MHPFNGLGDFAALPAAVAARPRAPRRGSSRSASCARDYAGARGRAARALAAPPLRPAASSSASGARCWTRASTADHDELPATYLWARTQPHAQRAHVAGRAARRWAACVGGHERLIEAAGAARRRARRRRSASAPASRASSLEDGARRRASMVDGEAERFDLTIADAAAAGAARACCPEPLQAAARRLPAALPRASSACPQGAPLAAALLLGQHLRPDADHHGGRDLARRRHRAHRRPAPGLPAQVLRRRRAGVQPRTTSPIYDRFTDDARASSSPDFRHEDVVDWTVQRAPLVEPVHARGARSRASRRCGPASRASALASASQIYPRLLNGDSIVRLAEQVADRDVRATGPARHAGGRRAGRRLSQCTRSRAHRSSWAASVAAAAGGPRVKSASTSGARSSCWAPPACSPTSPRRWSRPSCRSTSSSPSGRAPLQFGIVDGIYQGATALVRLLAGVAADRRRRHKPVAVAGYAISAVCKLALLARRLEPRPR